MYIWYIHIVHSTWTFFTIAISTHFRHGFSLFVHLFAWTDWIGHSLFNYWGPDIPGREQYFMIPGSFKILEQPKAHIPKPLLVLPTIFMHTSLINARWRTCIAWMPRHRKTFFFLFYKKLYKSKNPPCQRQVHKQHHIHLFIDCLF